MPNLSDRKPTDRFHGMIYGESGCGKTYTAGTFPDPYFIDTDYGLETLAGRDIEYNEYYARPDDAQAKVMWTKILNKVNEFVEDPPHETLVIDSLTTAMDVAAAHILSKTSRSLMKIQDYTPLYDEVTKLIVRLRRVDANVVVTAHEETIRDENTGKIRIIPLVTGQKFGPKLPLFFTNIYNLVVDTPKINSESTERYLLVQPDGKRLAKTQVDSDTARIEPSYEGIMEHLRESESDA